MPFAATLPAAAPPPAMPVLPNEQEVTVHGALPHCHKRAGDPLDAVDVSHATGLGAQVIAPDMQTGNYRLQADNYPVLGPDVWQRVGLGIDDYVFRVPADGTPLCIGSRSRGPNGWGQLRRGFDARPYRGRVVRFTAFVATQKVDRVTFWLAASDPSLHRRNDVVLGSDSIEKPLSGSHPWMPITYTIGPVPCRARQISYGVTLIGGGDVWIYRPAFQVVPDAELPNWVRSREKRCPED